MKTYEEILKEALEYARDNPMLRDRILDMDEVELSGYIIGVKLSEGIQAFLDKKDSNETEH